MMLYIYTYSFDDVIYNDVIYIFNTYVHDYSTVVRYRHFNYSSDDVRYISSTYVNDFPAVVRYRHFTYSSDDVSIN